MTKKPTWEMVVHKKIGSRDVFFRDLVLTVCHPNLRQVEASSEWSRVTCKNCLRARRKR